MSDRPTRRVRALFVADPGSGAQLVSAAKAFLARGAGITEVQSSGGDLTPMEMAIADSENDLVVVLRSQSDPSHRVLTAISAARKHHKPIHVLFHRDVAPAVDADESHMIALDRRWETDNDLYAWADHLRERFGKAE
ncbi:MAG: hypothetical protein ACHQ01_09580 [Candidatus Limnocylindrales bacterium]